MKYVIISTYPKNGTQNIGDALIFQKTKELLKHNDPESEVIEIWREDQSEEAKSEIINADQIIFACLAIRGDIKKTYPLLETILDSDTPFSVISAGTSLRMSEDDLIQPNFSDEDIAILTRTINKANVFTTRGPLTQQFVKKYNKEKPYYTGDVAFGKAGKPIEFSGEIKTIGISDPHYINEFEASLRVLILKLREEFPKAKLTAMIHGKNPKAESIFLENGVEIKAIYQNPEKGLSEYQKLDIHVGYRVHGHVSALAAGKPSYLLEQDGRGADYGLALGARCSVPSYAIQTKRIPKKTRLQRVAEKFKSIMGKQKKEENPYQSLSIAPSQIVALLALHKSQDFPHLQHMNTTIEAIRRANTNAFEQIFLAHKNR